MSSVTVSTSVCGDSKPSRAASGLKTRTSERARRAARAEGQVRERAPPASCRGVRAARSSSADAAEVAAQEALRELRGSAAAAGG